MRLSNLHKLRVGRRGVFTITAVAVIISVLALYAYMSSLPNALTTYNEAYVVSTFEEVGPRFTVKATFFGIIRLMYGWPTSPISIVVRNRR